MNKKLLTSKEAKVGLQVRIESDYYGFLTGDIGIIHQVNTHGVYVSVAGRTSTSGLAPYVSFRYVDSQLSIVEKKEPIKFCVIGGSQALKDAFQKELEALGIIYQSDYRWEELYPACEYWLVEQKERRNRCYDVSSDTAEVLYNLPKDYNAALEAFKQVLNWVDEPRDIVMNLRQGDKIWTATINKNSIDLYKAGEGDQTALRKEDILIMIENLDKLKSLAPIDSKDWAIAVNEISIGCQKGFNVTDLNVICSIWSNLQ